MILTLPLRVAVGAARIGLAVAERVIDVLLPGSSENGSAPTASAAPAPFVAPEPRPEPEPEPLRPRRRSEPEPEHVSEEPVLVAESADAGAEDGPGAALSIDEPWEGYRRMKADDVIARVGKATREELAVIELYEGMHRRRKTVLAAAERRLRELSPPGRA
jgi:hypothetical protein